MTTDNFFYTPVPGVENKYHDGLKKIIESHIIELQKLEQALIYTNFGNVNTTGNGAYYLYDDKISINKDTIEYNGSIFKQNGSIFFSKQDNEMIRQRLLVMSTLLAGLTNRITDKLGDSVEDHEKKIYDTNKGYISKQMILQGWVNKLNEQDVKEIIGSLNEDIVELVCKNRASELAIKTHYLQSDLWPWLSKLLKLINDLLGIKTSSEILIEETHSLKESLSNS